MIFLAFMIFRGITGEVISGFAVNNQNSNLQYIGASSVGVTDGSECRQTPDAERFAVGRVLKNGVLEEESSAFYFNLSGIKDRRIQDVEFCIVKYNKNPYGFEFFILPLAELKCPNELLDFASRRENKIAGRNIKSFTKECLENSLAIL